MRPSGATVFLGILIVLGSSVAMSAGGCPAATRLDLLPSRGGLEGLWSLGVGEVTVLFVWNVDGGGTIERRYASGELTSLDPAHFPATLGGTIEQWNAGLSRLNASIAETIPNAVVVGFPRYGTVRFAAADDAALFVEGPIDPFNRFFLVGDLSGGRAGSDVGGGAVLQATAMSGVLDSGNTGLQGTVSRTLVAVGDASTVGGAGLTAQLSIAFTGERIGDAPGGFGVQP